MNTHTQNKTLLEISTSDVKTFRENKKNLCFILDSLTNTLQNVFQHLENTCLATSEFMNELQNGNFLVFDEQDKLLVINPKLIELISQMDIIGAMIAKNTLNTIRKLMTDYLLTYNSNLYKISTDYIDYSEPLPNPLFAYGSRLQPIDLLNTQYRCKYTKKLVHLISEETDSKLFIDSDNNIAKNGLPCTFYITNHSQLITDYKGNPFRYVYFIDPDSNKIKIGIKFSIATSGEQIKEIVVADSINLSIIKLAYIKQEWESLQSWLIPKFDKSRTVGINQKL